MELPRIEDLGLDLLKSTPYQRWQPVAMPYVWAGCFLVAWHHGWYGTSLFFLMLVFSATSTSTHDVVHGTLGLARSEAEWLLFLLGAPIFESGHAYRLTHLEHHRSFPHHDDPEGEAAHMPFWRVLFLGPTFIPKLWLWAWRKAARKPAQRRWLVIEAVFPFLALAGALIMLHWSTAPIAYWIGTVVSSWLYPLLVVHLPHRHFGETRISQAWTLRGRLIPRLFLPLAYHLEHHLYPMVPSHNLPLLAKRLEPYLEGQPVELLHVL